MRGAFDEILRRTTSNHGTEKALEDRLNLSQTTC